VVPERRSSVSLPPAQSECGQSSGKSIASNSPRRRNSDHHLSPCDESSGSGAELPLTGALGPSASWELLYTSYDSSGESQADGVARSPAAFDEGGGTSLHEHSVPTDSSEATQCEHDDAAFKAALQLYSAYLATFSHTDAESLQPAHAANPSTSGQAHGTGHRHTLSSNETCVEDTVGSSEASEHTMPFNPPVTNGSLPLEAKKLCDCRNAGIQHDASQVITQGFAPVAFAPNVQSFNDLDQAYQRRGTTVIDEHQTQLPGYSHNNGSTTFRRLFSLCRKSPRRQEPPCLARRPSGFRVSEARLPPRETVYPYPETARQRFNPFRRHAMA
jgi:hypothetical protein